jgi:hypothetical protein
VTVPPNAASQDFVGTPDAMTDTDGDGLLDDWELNGYRHANGDIVDLPAMGASAFKPDIFVEVDWMEEHRPEDEAIRKIVRSFANAPVYDKAGNLVGTGINLHVDVGPDSTDWVTMKKWDKDGEGEKIDILTEEIVHLEKSEGKELIISVYNTHFWKARRRIFHYSLWINRLSARVEGEVKELLGALD